MGVVLLVVIFSSVASMVVLYFYMTRNNSYWRQRNVPYFEPTPIVGHLGPVFMLKQSVGMRMAALHRQSSDPFTGIFSLNNPVLLVRDKDLLQRILIADFDYFVDRNLSPDPKSEPLLSQALIALKGQHWRQLRVRLTPSFTGSQLRGMLGLIQDCSRQLEVKLSGMVDGGESFDVKDIMARYTTDVIAACAFGLKGDSLMNPDSEFRKIGKQIFEQNITKGLKMALVITAPWLLRIFNLQVMPANVYSSLRRIIWSAVGYREKNKVVRNDILGLLMEIRKQTLAERATNPNTFVLDGDALVAQTLGYLVAGFETSSTAISITLYELVLNPDIQQKARRDIMDTLAKYDGETTYDAIRDMKYLHQVFRETLRKYPSLPFIDRKCVKRYNVPGSHLTLEPGTVVFVSVLAIHNDPAVFPDPDKFDPDRFTDEQIAGRHKFSYLPFGDGPRSCIGRTLGLLQSKIALVEVLRKFAVEPCAETPIPLEFNMQVVPLTLKGALPLKLRRL